MNLYASLRRAVFLACLGPVVLAGQNAKITGVVTPGRAEFRIPLEQSALAPLTWNRTGTPDSQCEFMWQVAVPSPGGSYTFGFYLYKAPGARPAHGNLQALLKAGQASVFKQDSSGAGTLVQNAGVNVSVEGGSIVIRLADPGLIRTIFGSRPHAVTVNTRALGADFQTVQVDYRD